MYDKKYGHGKYARWIEDSITKGKTQVKKLVQKFT
jgi:hypothetical protein